MQGTFDSPGGAVDDGARKDASRRVVGPVDDERETTSDEAPDTMWVPIKAPIKGA